MWNRHHRVLLGHASPALHSDEVPSQCAFHQPLRSLKGNKWRAADAKRQLRHRDHFAWPEYEVVEEEHWHDRLHGGLDVPVFSLGEPEWELDECERG